MRMAWPFTVNALLFASGACVFPFFVLYYQSLGFSGTQIGLLTGITPLITLVCAPLWTNLADRTQQHRRLMSVLILASAATVFAFPLARAFLPIVLVAVTYNAFAAPVMSFSDSATMAMLEGRKALYGRVRLGGTFGFGLAALVSGVLVQNYGLRYAFWTGGALQLVALLASQKLRHRPAKASEAKAGRVTVLLADRRWLPFLLLAFAGGLAAAVANTYLFPYMKELGASEATMGLALTLGTLSEVPIFFFGNRLIRRFGAFGLLVLAMLLTGARLVLFVFSTTPNSVLVLQLLSGLTFPPMWVAGVAYADEHAPPGMGATAQGLFSAMVFGFGAAIGGFSAGPLLENLGGRGMFLVFGLTVMVVVVVGVILQRYLAQRAPGVQAKPKSLAGDA
jgi:PPP family 3-phenylpropionic acid transporter